MYFGWGNSVERASTNVNRSFYENVYIKRYYAKMAEIKYETNCTHIFVWSRAHIFNCIIFAVLILILCESLKKILFILWSAHICPLTLIQQCENAVVHRICFVLDSIKTRHLSGLNFTIKLKQIHTTITPSMLIIFYHFARFYRVLFFWFVS